MAFDITSTLRVIASHLADSGYFASTQIGDRKQPFSDAHFHASVSMLSWSVVSMALDSTVELHEANVTIYRDALAEPMEDIELSITDVASRFADDIYADFTLGGNIRNVDIGGEFGSPFAATWGHLDIAGTIYRVVDIPIRCVVNSSTTLAA